MSALALGSKNVDDEVLKDRISELRSQGLTQKQIGIAVGLSHVQVSNILNGKVRVGPTHLDRQMMALAAPGVGVSWQRQNQSFRAQIRVNNKMHMIGYFANRVCAYAAYDIVRARFPANNANGQHSNVARGLLEGVNFSDSERQKIEQKAMTAIEKIGANLEATNLVHVLDRRKSTRLKRIPGSASQIK